MALYKRFQSSGYGTRFFPRGYGGSFVPNVMAQQGGGPSRSEMILEELLATILSQQGAQGRGSGAQMDPYFNAILEQNRRLQEALLGRGQQGAGPTPSPYHLDPKTGQPILGPNGQPIPSSYTGPLPGRAGVSPVDDRGPGPGETGGYAGPGLGPQGPGPGGQTSPMQDLLLKGGRVEIFNPDGSLLIRAGDQTFMFGPQGQPMKQGTFAGAPAWQDPTTGRIYDGGGRPTAQVPPAPVAGPVAGAQPPAGPTGSAQPIVEPRQQPQQQVQQPPPRQPQVQPVVQPQPQVQPQPAPTPQPTVQPQAGPLPLPPAPPPPSPAVMGGAGGSGPWLDPGVVSPAPAPQLSPIGMRPPPIFGNVRGNAMLDPGMTGGPDLYASMQELVAAPPPQQQDIPSYIAAQLMA